MSMPRATGRSASETSSPGRLPPAFLDRLSGSRSGGTRCRLSCTSSPCWPRWLHGLLVWDNGLAWLQYSLLVRSHWLARWWCWSLIRGNRSARPLLADGEHSLRSARHQGPWTWGPWACGLSSDTSAGG